MNRGAGPSRSLVVLLEELDARTLEIPFADYLSAVAIFYAPDPLVAARRAPLTVTLEQIHRVAWFHGLDLHVALTQRTPPQAKAEA